MFARFDYNPKKTSIERYLNDMIENELVRQELEKHEPKIDNDDSLEKIFEDFLVDLSEKAHKEASEIAKKKLEESPKESSPKKSPLPKKDLGKKTFEKKAFGPSLKPSPPTPMKSPYSAIIKPQSKEIATMKDRIVDLETSNNNLKKQNEELLRKNEELLQKNDELLQRIEAIEACLNRLSDIAIKHSKEIEIMKDFNTLSHNIHKKTDEQINEINAKISEMKKTENKLMTSIDKAIHIFEMLH